MLRLVGLNQSYAFLGSTGRMGRVGWVFCGLMGVSIDKFFAYLFW